MYRAFNLPAFGDRTLGLPSSRCSQELAHTRIYGFLRLADHSPPLSRQFTR